MNDGRVISGVLINVPVTISCELFDPSLTHFSGDVTVSVQQASGTDIARGSGFISGFVPNLPFPCDGAEHSVLVSVLADPHGPPFHGGSAVFSARVTALAGLPCFPGSTTCFTPMQVQFATVPPTAIRMH